MIGCVDIPIKKLSDSTVDDVSLTKIQWKKILEFLKTVATSPLVSPKISSVSYWLLFRCSEVAHNGDSCQSPTVTGMVSIKDSTVD
jgi:hypothetical protein